MTTKELEKKLKISENTCIHCPTLKLAKQVLNIFHQLGLKWCNEKHYTTYTNWDKHEENTLYYPFDGLYSSLKFANLTGYKVIRAEEFIALHTEKEEFNLENYIPKGDLIGFPKEIIAHMLECQVEQGNPRNVNIFESRKSIDLEPGGFDWYRTKEKGSFWYKVINNKNFDFFFETYPKKDNSQELETTKYVQVDNNTILSDITSTQSTEDNSQLFRVGDKVYDIMLGEVGIVKNIILNNVSAFPIEVYYENCGIVLYALEGKYSSNDKYPRLLHYRDDYDYSIIDFNNLPKRQNSKRWRAKERDIYYSFTADFKVEEHIENDDYFDKETYYSGNYFQTKEEAQEVADKLNKYFQELLNPIK